MVWFARFAVALLAVGAVAVLASSRLDPSGRAHPANLAGRSLPQPSAQPLSRPSAGAQVAWLWVQPSSGEQATLVAVDPTGRRVARLDQLTAPGMAGVYGVWRSADGATLFTVGADHVSAYAALDGSPRGRYPRAAGTLVADALSPDGRWLAMLLVASDLRLQVIDLRGGPSQVLPVVRDPNARLPGMQCSGGCARTVVWGMALFAPDSGHLYTLTDWGGPARVSAFSLDGGRLVPTGTAVDGRQGRAFPSCAAPAMAGRIVGGGRTFVAFCHGDGAVWFFDLGTLTSSGVVRAQQANPFGLSPVFTPDGRLLYLHQSPGFGDTMQVVDLTTHRLLGPVATPTDQGRSGPFASLVTEAHAGGVASTEPVSPDGLKLYSATDDGVLVLRIPDLAPVTRLARGVRVGEVWISGDGQTIYATADDGGRLVVMRADGGDQRSLTLPGAAGGFLSSEHG